MGIPMTFRRIVTSALFVLLAASFALAETCLTTGDMDPATRSAIENAARQYYGYTAAGDFASLRNNAIPALQSSFGGIERAVADNKANFAGQQPTIYSTYLLDATGGAPTVDNALFMCGVYNSPNRLQFSIPNLPAAKYALVIFDVPNSPKGPYWLSLILQQMDTYWKLAGFYPKQRHVGDKGPGWFLTQARDYRAKGQMHNAYFYYVTARDLALPVSFMMTRPIEKLDSEAEPIVPKDLPGDQPMTFTSTTGKTYQITEMRPIPVPDGLHLILKYKTLGDITDTRGRFTDNMDLIKSFAAKYPEYKDAFFAYEAWATDPQSGRDYETMLKMSEVGPGTPTAALQH
jgi:hypothetical protein